MAFNVILWAGLILLGGITLVAFLSFQRWREERRRAIELEVAKQAIHELAAWISALAVSERAISAETALFLQSEVSDVLDRVDAHAPKGGRGGTAAARELLKLIGDEAKSGDIAEVIQGIERTVVARLQVYIEASKDSVFTKLSSRAASSSPKNPEQASSGILPAEGALLAAITEKFYASWAFRIVGLALIAAAMLAVAGNLVIGSTTANLQERMTAEADKAIAEFKQSALETKQTLKGFQDDLTAEQGEFKKSIERSQQTIEREVAAFKAGSADMRAEIVAQVRTDLNNRTSILSNQIDEVGGVRLRQLNSKIVDLDRGINDLQGRLGELERAVEGRKTQLGDVARDIDRIKPLTDQAERMAEIVASLPTLKNDLETAVSDAKTAAGNAKAAAQDASQQDALVTKAHSSVIETLGSAQKDLGQREYQFGKMDERSAVLDGKLTTLEQRLGLAGNRVDALLAASPPKSVPTSERDLNEGWLRIQTALAKKGFYLVKVDGHFGKNTVAAVKAFQKSLGAATDGALTREQIDALWSVE